MWQMLAPVHLLYPSLLLVQRFMDTAPSLCGLVEKPAQMAVQAKPGKSPFHLPHHSTPRNTDGETISDTSEAEQEGSGRVQSIPLSPAL